MNVLKAVAKIEKALGVKVEKNCNNQYYATYGTRTISFYQNGYSNDITCIHTGNVNDKADSMSDYFPGTYHDNITQAIRFVAR